MSAPASTVAAIERALKRLSIKVEVKQTYFGSRYVNVKLLDGDDLLSESEDEIPEVKDHDTEQQERAEARDTPRELPELAKLNELQRWHATGDYAYPVEEADDGEFVRYDDVAALASQPRVDAGTVEGRPTAPGIYKVSGFHIGHDDDFAVVEVIERDGELLTNLHEVNSDRGSWSRVDD